VLSRFVLLDPVPANAESWMLARVFELARRAGIRGVLSFSDPVPRRRADGTVVMPGHVDLIYQAANATYLGRTAPRTLALLPDGAVFSDRAASKVRGGERGRAYAERLLRRWGAPPRRPDEEPTAWLHAALAAAGVRRVRHPGLHRYAFALGPARRAVAVVGWPRPYPKRPDALP
jgi:hypothetical protein